MTLSTRILASRFLTHSGDQAWDLAVPLVLLKVLPGQLRVAAIYYLLVRLSHLIIFPHFSGLIDRISRPSAVKVGLAFQVVGVILGAVCILNLNETFYFSLAGLIVAGTLATLGSVFMDIVVANDIVPAAFAKNELTRVNNRLRQMDLITEVTMPVLAGLVLIVDFPGAPLLGFILIALWNVLSFIPEYWLLNSIFVTHPELKWKAVHIEAGEKIPFWRQIGQGWRTFFKEPVALAVLAFAFICLSVLSPHGVLLTAFLKDSWKLPELEIGIFRGLGAAFGLLATLSFGWVTRRLGLAKGTQLFLCFQAVMIVACVSFFAQGGRAGQLGFLACIILSRIGLYGFALGEVQIRQIGIAENKRGRVNGFANALTSIPGLLLYGAAALMPSTGDFFYLVVASMGGVVMAAMVFSVWVWRAPLR